MDYQTDWLTRFMELLTVTGKVEIRCALGAPWGKKYAQAGTQEIPYHIILTGRVLLENSDNGATYELRAGDIALLPHGSAHLLHDGSGAAPVPSEVRPSGSLLVSENGGTGEVLDMLCGRFFVAPPHGRLIRSYLPSELVVRTEDIGIAAQRLPQTERLIESVKQHGRSTTTILAGQRGSCRCIRSYLTLLLRSCRCVIVEVDAHRYCATLPSSGNWPLNGLAGLSSCN